jgi:NADH-quinone oxidoreductase subunit E
MSSVETAVVPELIREYGDQRSALIPILQEVQNKYRYLPQPVLRRLSEELAVPLVDIYHVATFYNCFSLEPVGRNLVQVCLGTACHVRGAPKVLDRLLTELNLAHPGTTKDVEYTVRAVRCIGCCGLAPVVKVNETTHPHMVQARVKSMLKKYARKPQANAD